MGDNEFDALCEALLVFTEFGTPSTKPVDFNAIIGGNLKHEARELLRVATHHRETLIDGLSNSGKKVEPRNVIGGVEHYLPYIHKITHSMEQSASAQIKLNKPLEFSWTSVLVKKAKQKKEYKGNVLVYEMCFILTIQALAHYNVAKWLLEPNVPNRKQNLVPAVKQLRQAAGILEVVSQALLPRWVKPPTNRPPEVMQKVAHILSQSFLAMAQRITVVQAIETKKPASALAKLLIGLSERYNNITSMCRGLDQSVQDLMVEELLDEPHLMAPVCYSMGLQYLGESAKEKTKAGEAVAFLQFASDNMGRLTYTPQMEVMYHAKITAAKRAMDAKFLQFKGDNESIYFDGVPTRDRLEIPGGSFIITPADYSLPEVEAVSFASEEVEKEASSSKSPKGGEGEKRKSLSSWFGMGSKSSKEKASAASSSEPLKAPPGYDAEVFNSLPTEIQQEVVAQYKAENK